ncbi:MAG: hypothetical protein IJQ80_06620 [Clostridia bacterium]|nr:hypothetical protein [Clostridia bacterium]
MKEMIRRAGRTFIQAAAGYVAAHAAVTMTGVAGSSESLRGALLMLITAAVACGISAVMNLPGEDGDE